MNAKPSALKLIDILAPTLEKDSLLAPLKIRMVFMIDSLNMNTGDHELIIDPKLLFLNGNQFINMAKDSVQFTEEQEKEIGRFLQIKIFGSEPILFTSTYPGYIKKDKKMVSIYGVFYDETILRIKNSQYPNIKIEFKSN